MTWWAIPKQIIVWCGLAVLFISACQPTTPFVPEPIPTRGPTATAVVIIEIREPLPTPTESTIVGANISMPGNTGLLATLRDYDLNNAYDPDDSIRQSFVTLRNFVDPTGPYRGAWWFADDGLADIYELIAVLMYTEGNTNQTVQQAVAARYIWYCGGQGPACNGRQLLNFLSYFQPWREPQATLGNFMHPHAQTYKSLAEDLVLQRPGSVPMQWLPGAELYVHNPSGLDETGPVNWDNAPFHFANVHPTWDVYLQSRLARRADGRNRLWVLTFRESVWVCGRNGFICPNMTLPRVN